MSVTRDKCHYDLARVKVNCNYVLCNFIGSTDSKASPTNPGGKVVSTVLISSLPSGCHCLLDSNSLVGTILEQ